VAAAIAAQEAAEIAALTAAAKQHGVASNAVDQLVGVGLEHAHQWWMSRVHALLGCNEEEA
jgi:hypothetical protein